MTFYFCVTLLWQSIGGLKLLLGDLYLLNLAKVTLNLALYGYGGLIAQQGHISLNTNLYLSQF